jgi:hypothetical protein
MLKAAFVACLRSHQYPRIPTIADVRQHLKKAQSNAADEEAGQKWTQVLEYIRVRWSPDIPSRNAPGFREQVQRGINAAGGLAYIADCELEAKQWARKRFVEQYIRYGELQQERFLLPDGALKNLLADVAQTKALPSSAVPFEELHQRGVSYAKEIAAPQPEKM